MSQNVSSAAVVIVALRFKIITLAPMIGPDVLNALHAGKFRKLFFRFSMQHFIRVFTVCQSTCYGVFPKYI